MSKKLIALPILLAFVAFGCGKANKYADVKEVLTDTVKIQETYISAMQKAANAGDVIAAVKGFGEGMSKLLPKVKELDKKYPELKDKKDIPADLKPLMDQIEANNKKLEEAAKPIMAKYMKDPNVLKAMAEMGKSLGGME